MRNWRDDPRFGDVLMTTGGVTVRVITVTPYVVCTEVIKPVRGRGQKKRFKCSWPFWRDHYPRHAVKLVESELCAPA